MTYFVIFVGLCAAALMWFIFSTGRKNKTARHTGQNPRHHEPHYQARHVHEPLHHYNAHSPDSSNTHIWTRPRRHALEEEWKGKSISATRLRSDDEPLVDEATEGPAMTEIEYTPVELPRASNQKN